jgi:iron(III) transport system permease protein
LLYAAGAVIIALPVAYGCARVIYNRRKTPLLSTTQDFIVGLPVGIPHVIFGVGVLLLYTETPLRLYATGLGMVVLYVIIVLPFATRLQVSALANIGPDLNAVGSVCGAGFFRRLIKIDLPLLRPALGAAAALIIVIASQEFTASILVASANTQVMGTALYNVFTFSGYPVAGALSVVMCLISALGVGLAFLIGGRGAFSSRRETTVVG